MANHESSLPALSHFGLCVSNLQKSEDFYIEALGFELEFRSQSGDEVAPIAELSEVDLLSVFLRFKDVRLELMEYAKPGFVGPAARRPMNQLGLTHLAFNVDDIEKTIREVERWGGTAHKETRTSFRTAGQSFEIIFCTDPDGTRVELVRRFGPHAA